MWQLSHLLSPYHQGRYAGRNITTVTRGAMGVAVVVGRVFLVDPHAFQRHRSSQTQRQWWWQTWSDTAEVLRKRFSPEIHSTQTNRLWRWRFTRTNLWFSSWICPLCDQISFAASCAEATLHTSAEHQMAAFKVNMEGKKHLYTSSLSQGRNNKDRLMTQPPRGRKDLDWCILSRWQSLSLFYVWYKARQIGAVSAPFYTVTLERVCCYHSSMMSASCHKTSWSCGSDRTWWLLWL